MNKNEVIVFDGLDHATYLEIMSESVDYALLSVPFTINRIGIDGVQERVLNIAKGKFAEKFFSKFCEINDVPINTEPCETPYWKIDKRDFLLNDYEWDIKNNYFYSNGSDKISFENFPALIPNRNKYDQWEKRLISEHQKLDNAFLFTFIQNATIDNGKRSKPFLDVTLNENQIVRLNALNNKYCGCPIDSEPYPKEEFLGKFKKMNDQVFSVNNFPPLIITAIAMKDDWNKFKNTGPLEKNNYFIEYKDGWYTKSRNGTLSFLDSTIFTRISNMTVPIEQLKAFSRFFLFKNLKKSHFLDD